MRQSLNWEKWGRVLVYIIFSATVAYVMFQTPYCHDEWKWGSPDSLELMKQGFSRYNGRYLGDLLAIAITRSVLVKTLVMAGGMVWLLFILESGLCGQGGIRSLKSFPQKRLFLLLCAAFLLLALPKKLYAQSYGWPAAFVNFVPPTLLLLLYFNWTEPLYRGEETRLTWKHAVLAVPLGISTQLFSEHTTLFALIYAAWVIVFAAIRKRKICAAYVVYFVSALFGAVLMFSNSAYLRIANGLNSYKSISLSLSAMWSQFIDRILDPLFLNNWLLNTLLAGAVFCCMVRSRKKTPGTVLLSLVLCGYPVYSIWHRIYPAWVFSGTTGLNHLIQAGLSFLFFGSVLAGIWNYTRPEERMGICVLYMSSVLVSVPLMAANPIGERCFYVSYLFQCAALLRIVRGLIQTRQTDLYYPNLITGFSCVLLCIIYIRMFSVIGAVNENRAAIIQTAVEQGDAEISLPVLPYSDYIWTTVPQTELWEHYFKEFYGIPEETVLTFY